ncbi:DUF1566 domain-containing protein [Legionella maioricensis]|uniref:DUF1566 domain-containing protein n=1 Tax=Legionella maioricensis TaxID=2896528 RepID=A0A9X2D2W4_9GAMM|nr:DUF1566 domain-containing protein [Legionella maioricensis]MCL9685675.1 DUF1566 domain-containing protein [Legionella maioricensis]MCL9689103.1 DUF1566 domain-containing protein [Legionella maioricensis]
MRDLIRFFIACMVSCSIHAGKPMWTFLPLTATTLTVSANNSATVQYTVTNQSFKPHTLAMQPIKGIKQITNGSGICPNPFALRYLKSCTLTLEIDGSLLQSNIAGGPVVCQTDSKGIPNPNACYQPEPNSRLNITRSSAPGAAIISSSVTMLTLSVACPTPSASCTYSNAALTGTSRLITITNTSSTATALNVAYDATGLPAGTSITPASCDIAPGDSCLFTVTPGQTASTVSGIVNIVGTNTNTLSLPVNVLTYGNVYQSGYVFAIDDSTPATTSISGKVAALADQSSLGIPWDPGCPGSCTNPIAANSNFNGSTNTTNIYNAMSLTHAAGTYAAGLCYHVLIGNYTDWYLPAICETGYGGNSLSPCGDVSNPTLQNMQSNLVDNGIVPLTDSYWSSTQTDIDPIILADFNIFGIGGNQPGDVKETSYLVRCIRIMSP